MLTIGSLCSGYGGLDLAVERFYGARAAWFCEIDPKAAAVFSARWPGVPNLRDVKMTHFGRVPRVDIITAGYPCQPFSHAGRRGGADDPRHLWPFVAQAVRRVRPRHVVLENVAGHRSMGFDVVLGDLAALGYDARWTSLRAADVGAPHGRERLFIVATDATREPWSVGNRDAVRAGRGQIGRGEAAGASVVADATDERHERGGRARHGWPRSSDSRLTAAYPERSGCDGWAYDQIGRTFGRTLAAGIGARSEQGRIVTHADGGRPALPALPISGHPGDRVADQRFVPGVPARPADTNSAFERRRTSRGYDGVRAEGLEPSGVAWAQYEPAIRRWERVLGRVAPAPTEAGPKGGQRLAPRFVEWMQGLPDGWVCDVPGLSRNDMLRILGNGVVPQQAFEAQRRIDAYPVERGA